MKQRGRDSRSQLMPTDTVSACYRAEAARNSVCLPKSQVTKRREWPKFEGVQLRADAPRSLGSRQCVQIAR